MTRQEFAAVMAYLAAGCGKALSEDALNVYFDLLRDLSIGVLQVAAQRALLEGQYPVFPSVGTLRQLAVETLRWASAPDKFQEEYRFKRALRPGSGIALLTEAMIEKIASGDKLLGHKPGREEGRICLERN